MEKVLPLYPAVWAFFSLAAELFGLALRRFGKRGVSLGGGSWKERPDRAE